MTSRAAAQGPDVPKAFRSRAAGTESSVPSPVAGRWSYRSFVSNPDLTVEPNQLLFGSGTMDLSVTSQDDLTGTLGGEGWQLMLTGRVVGGTPTAIRFTGKGIIGGEEWIYDYLGYAVPAWPNGVDQRPAIVGTIVRTKAHSAGTAKAGVVAQWIAVKQDAAPPTPAPLWNAGVRGQPAGEIQGESAKVLLQALEAKWAATVATNDPDQIGKFFTDDFLFVGAGGVLQDRQQHLNDFKTGLLKIDSVTIKDFTLHTYANFAVVNTLTHVEGKLGTRDLKGEYRFMDTWTYRGDQWLAIARQQTKVAQPSAGSPQIPSDSQLTPYQRLLRAKYLEQEPQAIRRLDSAPLKVLGFAATSGSLRPTTVHSAAGRLDVTLDVAYGTVRIGQDDVKLRMYNGKLVGPVLRARAGDPLYITLNNRLPLEPAGPHGGNGHHEWNTTNLHFHGLHVAPQGPAGVPDEESDNVLLELMPSNPFDPSVSTQKYKVKIPTSHVAGTFWYHAHKHGAVAAQVSSGMAGALIIERDDDAHNLDSLPEVAAAREEIMVLQEIPYLKKSTTLPGEIERSPDTDPDPNQLEMFSPGQWKALRRYITVNGEKIPTITMAPGEVRRFRFIHTGQRESVKLRIERAPGGAGAGPGELPLHEIAVDGLPTGTIRTIDRSQAAARDQILELFPGYRSDVLVQVPGAASGEFYLVDTSFDVSGTPRPDKGADGSPEPVRRVARIVVAGSPVTMSLPAPAALLPHRLDNLLPSAATGTQYAFYGLDLTAASIGFFISRRDLSATTQSVNPLLDQAYDPSHPRQLSLGKTERWLVGSRNSGASVTHPFHIHVNPFLITKVTSLMEASSPGSPQDVTVREIGSPTWRDTLAMKQGYTYEVLTRYDDYTGSFVDHCHILDHEDNGMMELVRIDSASTPPPTPLADRRDSVQENTIASTIPIPNGKPSALFFVQGSLCPHCMTQLNEMATLLARRKLQVAVVSASTEADLRNFPKVPFRLVADPELKLFKKYDAFDGKARHATIVRDGSGEELFRKVGDEPFMDAGVVLASLDRALPRYVVAVRKTDDTKDDYLTWAPTRCQIRMENGVAGGPDVMVTLTNDSPTAVPDGGDVRFATSLAVGATATAETITVNLKQDGTPVDFFVAGFKASKLTPTSLMTGGRDAVIEIHQGGAAGSLLGSTAVMVRVRKHLKTMSDFEIAEFLKAVHDLHVVDNRYEKFVLVHRQATQHSPSFGDPPGENWPDQAHGGAGFIAWHRAFLLQFERELQSKFPHVALPYWIQGQAETFFAEDQLGTMDSAGDVVKFSRLSPIWGWSISLPGDHGGPAGPMGVLRRNPKDHNDPSIAFYRQWSDFQSLPQIEQFSTMRRLEVNPHNNGHTTVGPPGIWMSLCRESNADPVFWVFHNNHDYLWAKWQRIYNRFRSDGSDPAHYSPNDGFADAAANRGIPLGHHLRDEMWPWDGTTNQVIAGEPNSTRPNASYGPFPAATFPFQWPAAPAKPRPADVIDYLGINSGDNEFGYCYDDVPYGAQPLTTPLAPSVAVTAAASQNKLNSAMFLQKGTSPDLRLAAGRQIRESPMELTIESLVPLIGDKQESADVRAEALRHLSIVSPTTALQVSLKLLEDPDVPASLGVKAVSEAGSKLHFSQLSHDDMSAAYAGLRRALSAECGPVKVAAIRHLAPVGDAGAKALLTGFLKDPSKALLPTTEIVSLLRFFPDQHSEIRERISSANEDVAIAAIQALQKDVTSAAARRRVALDQRRGVNLRKAAIQSIMHDDSTAGASTLVDLFCNASEDLEVRAEAIAAARVYFQRQQKALTDPDRSAWAAKIDAVPTGAHGISELGTLKSQALQILAGAK